MIAFVTGRRRGVVVAKPTGEHSPCLRQTAIERLIGLHEEIKYSLLHLGRDTNAGILDAQHGAAVNLRWDASAMHVFDTADGRRVATGDTSSVPVKKQSGVWA